MWKTKFWGNDSLGLSLSFCWLPTQYFLLPVCQSYTPSAFLINYVPFFGRVSRNLRAAKSHGGNEEMNPIWSLDKISPRNWRIMNWNTSFCRIVLSLAWQWCYNAAKSGAGLTGKGCPADRAARHEAYGEKQICSGWSNSDINKILDSQAVSELWEVIALMLSWKSSGTTLQGILVDWEVVDIPLSIVLRKIDR